MFHINIDQDMNIEQVIYEIWLGNELIHREQVRAPEDMLKMMFLNYVQQMAGRHEPMHLRMSGQEVIWDEFEQRQKVLPKRIDYWNYNYEGEI